MGFKDRMSMKGVKNTDGKLVMLGAPGVGKSALVVRYLTKRFIWEYDPTLECSYKHCTQIDDEPTVLDILDTAGQTSLEGEQQNSEGHVRWGDGFMLVYSITDKQSFQLIRQLKYCLDDIKKARNVSCVIVANKNDLHHERKVTTEEGEQLAADLAAAYFETSACNGGNEIEEAYHELYREIKRRRIIEAKSKRRTSAQQVKQVLNKVFTKIQNGS